MPARLIETPVGPVLLLEDSGRLREVRFATGNEPDRDNSPLLDRAEKQVQEFFAGIRQAFDLPLTPAQTAFQERVRSAMMAIPYGQTRSYGEIAHSAGGGPRAVGQACGANLLPLIVPCHRVVAASGIGGYSGAGGLDTKRLLLQLEQDSMAG